MLDMIIALKKLITINVIRGIFRSWVVLISKLDITLPFLKKIKRSNGTTYDVKKTKLTNK